MKRTNSKDEIIILKSSEGREYKLGPMTAIFKADENETDNLYGISEWWLEPHSEGPHAHQHEDKESSIYVIEGTISFLVGDNWVDADKGTFIRIPKNTNHTFANRTNKKAGFLNIDIPGGFEDELPGMVKWFEENEI